jgi:hypothetical protein
MEGSVANIILTVEYLESGRPDYENLNTDVIVQFQNGDRYFATFISYKNLKNMINELYLSEEKNGQYKVLNAVLIKDFNNGNLLPVIESMLAEGDFQLVFRKM